MSDDRLVTTMDSQETNALVSLEQVLVGYELPGVYNQMLIRHWMDLANAVLEEYGEESDNWRRMIWFSRIVCNSILTSLEQGESEPLEDSLKTFMTWLGLCHQETGNLELAQVAAQYLSRRLKTQMAEDVGEGGTAGGEETIAMQASRLAAEPRADPPPDAESMLELELDSMVELEIEPTSEAEPEPMPEPERDLDSELELEPMPESVSELEPETMPEPGPEPVSELQAENMPEPGPEPVSELELEPMPESVSELQAEPLPAVDATVATEKTVAGSEESNQTINTLTGSNTMDIPTLAKNAHLGSKNEPEISSNADSGASDRRGKRKSLEGPIPIGVWLGFHDEDISTMARLAVYDRANDNYIFANKQGFLVRQLGTPELLDLIEDELIDIIERRVVTRTPTS